MRVDYFIPALDDSEERAVCEVLKSGWLTTGPRCRAFESAFAAALGSPFALAVNSCTAALHLALEAVGVARGDYVLVPSFTFAATAEVVRYLDATPVFVDANQSDCTMSLPHARQICQALWAGGTPARAIIPVHYGGKMVDMVGVRELAREFSLRVVEDAAHAFPSWIEKDGCSRIYPGSLSDAACFSFYANKTITTGEGGMVITHDAQLMKRMRLMALHGIDRDAFDRYSSQGGWYYEVVAPGFKYNMSDIAAAIGLEQLKKCDVLRNGRARVANLYMRRLGGLASYRMLSQDVAFHNSWHLFVVVVQPETSRRSRDEIVEFLKRRGITCSVHYTALHLMPYYAPMGAAKELPVATELSSHVISLPIYSSMSEEAVEYVCDALEDAAQ